MPATPAPRNSEHVAAGSPFDPREKMPERRARAEPNRRRELGEGLAKRWRRAERIAQHAAPVRKRGASSTGSITIVGRQRTSAESATGDRRPCRRAFEHESMALEPCPRSTGNDDGPVHHSIGTLRGGTPRCDRDHRVGAIVRQRARITLLKSGNGRSERVQQHSCSSWNSTRGQLARC